MRYQPIFIYVLLISTVIFTACQKDEDALPEETQQGANTFGCKINGEVWKRDRNDLGNSLKTSLEPNEGGAFTIKATKGKESLVGIGILKLAGEGIYPVYHTTENRDTTVRLTEFDIIFSDWTKGCSYRRLNPITYIDGFIEITKYDMENYIVAGRFDIGFN